MSAVTVPPAPITTLRPAPDGRSRRRFVIETTGAADVPVRVLVMLRRRGCEIVAVDFLRADRHRPGHFAIALDVSPRVGHRLEEWLRGVVDVLDVRRADE